ncbi:hypothetical protein PIB30_052675, partial [Stylosanthes scabra]|nr:hypothetical protein [Stylosanthes scabra]
DMVYHLGLRMDGDPISGCVRDFDQWYGVGTWQMAQDFLGRRPPPGEWKNYAGRGNLEISGCLPLVFSWIYQRFPSLCPPGRDLLLFPLVSRLDGLGQTSRDSHSRRMLDLRMELDQVGFDDRDIQPGWVTEEGEIETWRATVPIVLFMFVRFHHVDGVNRQFGSEQPIPLDPVNLYGFLRASARDEDKWWPDELEYWYSFWNNRRAREHQIQIVYTRYPGWPTKEYIDWWVVACRRRFLSADRMLQDPRGVQLPDDVSPAATQARDSIVLPRDAPAHGRRARMQRPDVRRKSEGAATGRRSYDQPGGEDVEEEAEYRRHEDIPDGVDVHDQGGADPTTQEADIDFFSGADLELARFILQGEGSGSGSAPHASADRPSGHHVAGPTPDMYDMFTCGDQMMDQIAQEYLASQPSEDPVYRPKPPLQYHPDPGQQCRGFQYYQPS